MNKKKKKNKLDFKTRIIVAMMKHGILAQIKGIRKENQTIHVNGTRYTLHLTGRDIDIVYYPAKRKNAPLILGFHGGGFLFGGCAMDDLMWDAMRNELDVNIASIDYRKAPEAKWPAGLEDAYDATVYLKEQADSFGFNPEHISVFGNSAGATIAASVCLYAKQKGTNLYEYQILNYPLLDSATDPADKGPGSLDGPIMYVFNELYFSEDDGKSHLLSPVLCSKEELTNLPSAIIITCENDSLKAEGEKYAHNLKDAGVTVSYMNASGMPHGYFEYGFSEGNNTSHLDAYMKEMIQNGIMKKAAMESLNYIKEHYKNN